MEGKIGNTIFKNTSKKYIQSPRVQGHIHTPHPTPERRKALGSRWLSVNQEISSSVKNQKMVDVLGVSSALLFPGRRGTFRRLPQSPANCGL